MSRALRSIWKRLVKEREGLRCTVMLHLGETGGFAVAAPELGGCITQEETFEAAIDMARDAIEGHLAVRAEEGWDIPAERFPIIPISIEVDLPMSADQRP